MDDAIDRQVDSRSKGTSLRTIVEMRLQGLSGSEIARRLGITKQAVSKRLKGALGILDGDRLETYRENRVAVLELLEEQILSEMVNPDRIKKASVNNLAYAFTQLHNARRLESNQSTANLSLAAGVASVEKNRGRGCEA